MRYDTIANEPKGLSMKLKIRKFGDAYGVVIPKRMLSALDLKSGDRVEMIARGGRLFVAPS